MPDGNGDWTMISRPRPDRRCLLEGQYRADEGPQHRRHAEQRSITWGWFEAGFDLTQTNTNGTTGCARTTTSDVTHVKIVDYIPHHEPFQYYPSTANPTHQRPSSVAAIGTADDGGANHQYDMTDLYAALEGGQPAVGKLPQGRRLPGRPSPAIPTRSTGRPSSSRR